ncbi:glycoside hydrolase [Sphingobacterium olei]|uniref:Glycoside hydrolase n=1 Tax=Sphingobacterium olei TaxID=2571155 RepID=A0A4U0P4N3_9SPHI|nr:family 43 glycosylhydrolase [Sphingobacterium olei]TJZ62180.1 glycoside hydrolase [Sphingobacterium olei]
MMNTIKNNLLLAVYVLLLFVGATHAQTYKYGPVEKDFTAYLFAYFSNNDPDGEQVRYAVSLDGINYKPLNGGKQIISSDSIALKKGVRDPHILRSADGKYFYMVLTDMRSSEGWQSNDGIVLLKSKDLLHWEHTAIDFPTRFPGLTGFDRANLHAVWAPQTIWDEKEQKYMIYYSIGRHDWAYPVGEHIQPYFKLYYSYANADFTDITEPQPLFDFGSAAIDGDIVYDSKNEEYVLFFKDEGRSTINNGFRTSNGVMRATSKNVTGPYTAEYRHLNFDKQQAVEGSSVFKLINSDEYVLMYDCYTKGYYQFCKSTDLKNFSFVQNTPTGGDFTPRHGSVIPITHRELLALTEKWGIPSGFDLPAPQNNPVLEGYYADPDILYSEKTKKYYIYPTSDGFTGWSGTYFKTFSSDNLKDWTDEGIILDLKKDVSWADRNAWAPCIIEKRIKKNQYKYYYYFTAAQKVGVAVAEDPTGPFLDSGKPLIDFKPEGVKGGQEIDPEVFYDPKSKKSYLYWGNGYLAVAELEKDMVSIKKNTIKVMTPDHTFREGVTVFYRKGLYYFLWSEDDTRSENYRVRYAYSKSAIGPLTIPEDNLILAKDPTKGIYATGHNSVLQIPGTDEWRIVYHRFDRPNGIKMGSAAGYHREVCIDAMEFRADGTIEKVTPKL